MGTFKTGKIESFVHWTIIVLYFMYPAVVVCLDSTKYVFENGTNAQVQCLFGNGTVKNIFWMYHNGAEYVDVVKLFKGRFIYGTNYEGHVDLHEDKSTLIIRDVSIGDEGRYKCDVDKEDGPSILNKISDVNVFVRPDRPYPLITECNNQGEENSCQLEFPEGTPFNLTCRLSGYYPRDNATLEWRIPGKVLPSTSNHTWENEDLTWDMHSNLNGTLSEPMTYMCCAKFTSDEWVEGANTSVMVFLKSYPPADKGKGTIIAISLVSVVVVIGVAVVVGVRKWKRFKRRAARKRQPQQAVPNQGTDDPSTDPLLEDPKSMAHEREYDGSNCLKEIPLGPLRFDDTARKGDEEKNSSPPQAAPPVPDSDKGFTEDAIYQLTEDLGNHENLLKFGFALGYKQVKVDQYLATNRIDAIVTSRGTSNMLFDWKKDTPKKDQLSIMRRALTKSGFSELAEQYCPGDDDDDNECAPPQAAANDPKGNTGKEVPKEMMIFNGVFDSV